jgi:exo-beta-1,3-glucanase (GH17 family)
MPTISFFKPGVTYNGLHATTEPTSDQVNVDFAVTKTHFDNVRTYYPQYRGGFVDVGKLAKDNNLNLLLGLYLFDNPDWIAGDYDRFVKPAVTRRNIAGILIGNEDPQMIDNNVIPDYLGKVRLAFPNIPVGTSQKTGFWLDDERAGKILSSVDFIGVNICPAWEWSRADSNNQPIGVTPEAGFNSFRDTYAKVQGKYPGKQIVVTETGWTTTFGQIGAKQFPVGISYAGRDRRLIRSSTRCPRGG